MCRLWAWLCLLIHWQGKGLKALTTGGILECFLPCVWDRVCSAEGLAARGNLEKGRNAQRVRAEEHPVASRRSQTQ